ncbi:thioredoxin reductase [Myroides gitamensis]|uniref:NAD(P)/FAD-dependent oxidoreductase n=1 Tax=Myroides odoratus TaxID=256 RepID=UPI00216AB0E8|nr:NAD(P)/FAD-dependent oxidoreductase [Myroides odoratus]MCS4238428.1 thioredoxin reductase [Myroides odoratus]MDH6600764.1 thioredoxin reductase [Myroides gitamensis]
MTSRRDFLLKSSLFTLGLLMSDSLWSFTPLAPEQRDTLFDVVIIGGSFSGLSAALALGRSNRKVLILDTQNPCNKMVKHTHNLLAQDGNSPVVIAHQAKEDVVRYDTVHYYLDEVTDVKKKESGSFTVQSKEGKTFRAKYVLFATGLTDIMPDIAGFEACWGTSILHCPYCHGYEVKNKKTLILGNGDLAFHYAILVHNLTSDLQIVTQGKASFPPEQLQALAKNKIGIIEEEITQLIHQQGQVTRVVLKTGQVVATEAIYAKPDAKQHCAIPIHLGCTLTPQGLLQVNAKQETSISGIYACGDTSSFRSLATAIATGSQAGASINMQLCLDNF